jgi:hypothetical protein
MSSLREQASVAVVKKLHAESKLGKRKKYSKSREKDEKDVKKFKSKVEKLAQTIPYELGPGLKKQADAIASHHNNAASQARNWSNDWRYSAKIKKRIHKHAKKAVDQGIQKNPNNKGLDQNKAIQLERHNAIARAAGYT